MSRDHYRWRALLDDGSVIHEGEVASFAALPLEHVRRVELVPQVVGLPAVVASAAAVGETVRALRQVDVSTLDGTELVRHVVALRRDGTDTHVLVEPGGRVLVQTSPDPAEAQTPGLAPWCSCVGAGTCVGCLLDAVVLREYGTEGLRFLQARTVGRLAPPSGSR